jgi:hypothetical protein
VPGRVTHERDSSSRQPHSGAEPRQQQTTAAAQEAQQQHRPRQQQRGDAVLSQPTEMSGQQPAGASTSSGQGPSPQRGPQRHKTRSARAAKGAAATQDSPAVKSADGHLSDSEATEDSASAASAAALMAQVRATQVELERQRLEHLAQRLEWQQQQQQLQQQLQQQQQQQQQQQAALPFSALSLAPREQVRMAAVQPGELTYRAAGEGTALADWLFKLEQLLSQLRIGDNELSERVRIAATHWDRQTDLWWRGHELQARTAGAPVASWAAFVAALKANFVPTNDAEAAASEVLKLRMRSGEGMDAYMQRAALLLARADGRLPDAAAARAALDGGDSARFPFAIAAARRQMRTSATPLSFNAVRAELTALAADEPTLGRAGGTEVTGSSRNSNGSNNSSGSSRSNGRNSTDTRQGHRSDSSKGGNGGGGGSAARMTRTQLLQRINALQGGLHGSSDEDSDIVADDESVRAAPVAARGGGGRLSSSGPSMGTRSGQLHCGKCGEDGHRAVTCTSKTELRSCLACHKQGHLVRACPQVRRPEASGEEGASLPKNK